MNRITFDSPVGRLCVTEQDGAITCLDWGGTPEGEETPQLAEARAQIAEYFAGTRTAFDVPLDLRGTDFQVAAWRALADIPHGTTVSYGEQARRIGRPSAVRAIGAANGRNPVPVVLPCHRVVGADGSLTGFGGGLEVKRALLDHERAQGSLAL